MMQWHEDSAGLPKDAVLIDMSSIPPSAARDHAAKLAAGGRYHLDAPVSGGTAGAEAGTLAIMAGGPEEIFERALPVFAPLWGTLQVVAPGERTHRAMAAYAVNSQLSLQLNLNNLTDEKYVTRVRNNGWATPGEARSAVLSATYRF